MHFYSNALFSRKYTVHLFTFLNITFPLKFLAKKFFDNFLTLENLAVEIGSGGVRASMLNVFQITLKIMHTPEKLLQKEGNLFVPDKSPIHFPNRSLELV